MLGAGTWASLERKVEALNRVLCVETTKVTLEQRVEKGQGVSHAAIWEQSSLSKENNKCKGSETGSV